MYEYRVKSVDHIVDGDTLDVTIDLGFNISHKIRVRMYGINTPESRTRDLEEKARGLASKKRLTELVTRGNRKITLTTKEKGKYGRYLGILYLEPSEAELEYNSKADSINVNLALVTEGFAVAYHGGKR
tara:strand:- start:586 stop:972 length:387 start_codon:yes stop_codon:yes gene_type:complete